MAPPTAKTIKRMVKYNDFWRESKIALKSGLYDRYWELDVHMRAWLIAAIESQETLDFIIAEYGHDDED